MKRVACIAGLFTLVLSGCGNLPDIQRAEKAAAEGDVQEARAQLEKLAKFGLADAQVELGIFMVRRTHRKHARRRWIGTGRPRSRVVNELLSG